jgi:hypothetical protein
MCASERGKIAKLNSSSLSQMCVCCVLSECLLRAGHCLRVCVYGHSWLATLGKVNTARGAHSQPPAHVPEFMSRSRFGIIRIAAKLLDILEENAFQTSGPE